MSPYPHESQIEFWISRAVDEYFDNLGYDVAVLPNTRAAEKAIPYDHLFAGQGVKVFGFQYKRLKEGPSDHWEIDIPQLKQLLNFPWIYYALPEITSIRQRRNALHLTIIAASKSVDKIIKTANTTSQGLKRTDMGFGQNKAPYSRWGGFVKALFACTEGWRPTSSSQLQAILADSPSLFEDLSDIYIVPLSISDSRLAIRLSSSVTNTQDQLDYDFGIDDQ